MKENNRQENEERNNSKALYDEVDTNEIASEEEILSTLEADDIDEKAREKRKSRKKHPAIFSLILIAAVSFLSYSAYQASTIYIIPQLKYNYAQKLYNEKNYDESIGVFKSLGSYSSAQQKVPEVQCAKAADLADKGMYDEAVEVIDNLDGSWPGASAIRARAIYKRAHILYSIGKYENAEAELNPIADYREGSNNASMLLKKTEYELAGNALRVSDFDTAAMYLRKIPGYEDADELFKLTSKALDLVFEADYTDDAGHVLNGAVSYIWVHSKITPGRAEEALPFVMVEDFSKGDIDPRYFGYNDLTYKLDSVISGTDFTFTFDNSSYYLSGDEPAGAQAKLEVCFSSDMKHMTTGVVYEVGEDGVLNPVELQRQREWTLVDDREKSDLIKECFRRPVKIFLARCGNLQYSNQTDEPDVKHYCSEYNCLNEGVYVREDGISREYYCEEHKDKADNFQ